MKKPGTGKKRVPIPDPAPRVATTRQEFTADAEAVGERLDRFLTGQIPDFSRSQIQRLIEGGHVTHSRYAKVKANSDIREGDVISVEMPDVQPSSAQPEDLPLDLLFNDPDLVVVNKPAGMVVHPAAGHTGGTLVNALLHHLGGLSGIGGTERPGIVHRLDRGTSGVMVVAKHDRAHRALSKQFQERGIGKEYVTLVWGAPQAGEKISRPIGRDPRHRQKMSSRSVRGRQAVTSILSVEPLGGVSLVRVAIETGRTHQIRVHLSETGHPIVGDALYGGARKSVPPRLAAIARIARPFLHAARLTLAHPADGRTLSFEAPLPDELARMLDALRRASGRPIKESADE
jgi:23S rRNA pseudouridine1911/1915/1917 synthase